MERKRILTGIRPTGALHLGHYAGALENWVRLQHEYEAYFLIADYQVSDYADDIARVRESVWEVALDWLAVGLDPESSSYVIESLVPEHAELTTLLGWFLPVSMLERNPTLKAEMDSMEHPEDGKTKGKSVPVAFYTYPVMQVANILMPRAHLVPVGEDQLPHIELTRETARRFNREFKPVFPEPEGLVGRVPRLVGTDGNAKMSKSRGNTIDLKDSADTVAKKIRSMFAGPPRGADEPGVPDENPIFLYLDAFDPNTAEVADLKDRYTTTGVGNKELKDRLTTALNDMLDPMRDRRARFENNMPFVRDALAHGTERYRTIARETMEMVRDALDMNYLEVLMLRPTLEEVREIAKSGAGNIVPIYREVTADLETPVSAFLKVRTGPYSFLLESVEGGERLARYSFIGTQPYRVLKTGDNEEWTGDPLIPLEQELSRFKEVPVRGVPAFTGGAIGYISYEAVRHFEPRVGRPDADPLGVPEAMFLFCDSMLVFDHIHHTIKVIAHCRLDGDIDSAYRQAAFAIDEIVERLNNPTITLPVEEVAAVLRTNGRGESNMGREGYELAVERIRDHVIAGDIIQAVPSHRLARKTAVHPFNIYRQLRNVNPSPYMFYLDMGEFQIVGASPELLVRVEDGIVVNHPIAGTRRRGVDAAEDAALAAELLADEKECAEHIMLVDLGRNDVGRVAKPGTVKVDQLMAIEQYSHVMHIVSHVSGELREDKTAFDAFRSVFPAGTVSGAPKVRAMEIIADLEGERRGVYAGAVGYASFAGSLDTCIAIRTMVVKDGVAYLQAGGGIVYDSVPATEFQETVNKLAAPMRAIDQAELAAAEMKRGSLGYG